MYITTRHLEFDPVIERSLKRIFFTFMHNDKEIFLVGGCVRDLLLGKTPKDYDLCTNATPEEVKKMFPKHYHFIDT